MNRFQRWRLRNSPIVIICAPDCEDCLHEAQRIADRLGRDIRIGWLTDVEPKP